MIRAIAQRVRSLPSPLRTVGGWMLAAAALAFLAYGLATAMVVVAASPVAIVVVMRRRGQQHARSIDDAIPTLAESIAAVVRAGASLPTALAEAATDAPAAARALQEAGFAFDVGASVDEAIDVFSFHAATDQARLLARALKIGYRSGGDLPRMLEVIASAARSRGRLEREAKAVAAQARMSAWIVASLPIVFLAMTGATSRPQIELLFGTPAGWALLSAGGLLELAGVSWMRRLSS